MTSWDLSLGLAANEHTARPALQQGQAWDISQGQTQLQLQSYMT